MNIRVIKCNNIVKETLLEKISRKCDQISNISPKFKIQKINVLDLELKLGLETARKKTKQDDSQRIQIVHDISKQQPQQPPVFEYEATINPLLTIKIIDMDLMIHDKVKLNFKWNQSINSEIKVDPNNLKESVDATVTKMKKAVTTPSELWSFLLGQYYFESGISVEKLANMNVVVKLNHKNNTISILPVENEYINKDNKNLIQHNELLMGKNLIEYFHNLKAKNKDIKVGVGYSVGTFVERKSHTITINANSAIHKNFVVGLSINSMKTQRGQYLLYIMIHALLMQRLLLVYENGLYSNDKEIYLSFLITKSFSINMSINRQDYVTNITYVAKQFNTFQETKYDNPFDTFKAGSSILIRLFSIFNLKLIYNLKSFVFTLSFENNSIKFNISYKLKIRPSNNFIKQDIIQELPQIQEQIIEESIIKEDTTTQEEMNQQLLQEM